MKKTKVLLHIPNREDGTAYYRSYPYFKIDSIDVVEAPTNRYLTWADLAGINVAFFQRPATVKEVLDIETCKKWGIPVIADFDDLYTDIQPSNPAYEFYNRDVILAVLDTIVKTVDAVTVSTEELKKHILNRNPEANVVVISNAIDDDMFSVEPYYGERNKTILLRGGGSHQEDWELYKDGIIQILKDNPEYTLSVMGYHPDWLKQIPGNRVRYYQFTTIETYFDTLMQIKPEVMIVPLVDNDFNRCKSAIAMYEGNIAGAVVMAPSLPEFNWGWQFCSNSSLIHYFNVLDGVLREKIYLKQLQKVPLLSQVNEKRIEVVEQLKNSTKKKAPTTQQLKPATDLEFHQYALSHGHTQDNPEYQKAHSKAVEWLIKNLSIKNALELGAGTGGTLLELLKQGVLAHGFEINPHSVDYFKSHYPIYEDKIHLIDFTKEPIEVDTKGDLVLSIEVFEHIQMPEEWWVSFLTDLSKKFKYFYFSSTPYSDPDSFMEFWGHINIRRTSDWIKLFEQSGWKFEKNPRLLTTWDLLFSA